ncbi:MAG: hypothetical protein Q8P13_04215 [bacterium]|nr:hypothetical protein [bacterium]
MGKLCFFFVLLVFFLAVPKAALSDIGVGVGTGKIVLNEKLKPGATYKLPPLTVFNTGTVTATYKIRPAFNEKQSQKKPKASWFSFSPEKISINPKKSEVVTARLSLPLSAPPGDYFVYLEAVPDQTVQKGTTSVGVAAATKLYFTVVPANFLMALLYRIISIYQQFAPWSYLLTLLVVSITLIIVLRRVIIRLLLTIARLLEKI